MGHYLCDMFPDGVKPDKKYYPTDNVRFMPEGPEKEKLKLLLKKGFEKESKK